MRKILSLIIWLVLFASLVFIAMGVTINTAVEEDYILDSFAQIDLYKKLDLSLSENNVLQEGSLVKSILREGLNPEDIYVYFLLAQEDAAKYLEETAKDIVPSFARYLKGQDDELKAEINIKPIQEKIKEELSDFDIFISLFKEENPQEFRYFSILPESLQRYAHEEFIVSTIDRINLPTHIDMMDIIRAGNPEVITFLEKTREVVVFSREFLAVFIAVAAISLIFTLTNGTKGVKKGGYVLVLSGLGSFVLFKIGGIILGSTIFSRIVDPEILTLGKDFSNIVLRILPNFTFAYVIAGIIFIALGMFRNKIKNSKGYNQ